MIERPPPRPRRVRRGLRPLMALALGLLAPSLPARPASLVLVERAFGAPERALLVPFLPCVGVELHLRRGRGALAEAVEDLLPRLLRRSGSGRAFPLPEDPASASFLFGPAVGGAVRIEGVDDRQAYLGRLAEDGFGVEDGGPAARLEGGDLLGVLEGSLLCATWGPRPGEAPRIRLPVGRGLRVHRLGRPRSGKVLSLWVRSRTAFFREVARALPFPPAEAPHPVGGLTLDVRLTGSEAGARPVFRATLEVPHREERDALRDWIHALWSAPADPEVRLLDGGVRVEWAEPAGVREERMERWVSLLRGWLGEG